MRLKNTLVFAVVTGLYGCTSLPPLHDTDTYSKMNCMEIDTEIAAVDAHKSNADDNAGFGFMDFLSAVTTGIASGSGRADLLAQQSQVNASLDQGHAQGKADAEAHGNRLELLNRIKGIRKCT